MKLNLDEMKRMKSFLEEESVRLAKRAEEYKILIEKKQAKSIVADYDFE